MESEIRKPDPGHRVAHYQDEQRARSAAMSAARDTQAVSQSRAAKRSKTAESDAIGGTEVRVSPQGS